MFAELIAALGNVLGKKGLPYMIIDGQAVLLYGEPRLTRDIDITLGIGAENLADVVEVVESMGLRPLVENIETFVQETMVLPVVNVATGIRVDFIFSFTPYEHEAINRSRKISFGDTEVSFASPEDVIIHKIFAGRPRDLEDIKGIILKTGNLDMAYIRKWLDEFEKSSGETGLVERLPSLAGGGSPGGS